MKPSQFSQLSGYLESEYITSANKRTAIMLNIGAILIIIGILGGAIWKIKMARKRKLNFQDKRPYELHDNVASA